MITLGAIAVVGIIIALFTDNITMLVVCVLVLLTDVGNYVITIPNVEIPQIELE